VYKPFGNAAKDFQYEGAFFPAGVLSAGFGTAVES
jgi:hypothetical protein